jgi:hypothetical protein
VQCSAVKCRGGRASSEIRSFRGQCKAVKGRAGLGSVVHGKLLQVQE